MSAVNKANPNVYIVNDETRPMIQRINEIGRELARLNQAGTTLQELEDPNGPYADIVRELNELIQEFLDYQAILPRQREEEAEWARRRLEIYAKEAQLDIQKGKSPEEDGQDRTESELGSAADGAQPNKLKRARVMPPSTSSAKRPKSNK